LNTKRQFTVNSSYQDICVDFLSVSNKQQNIGWNFITYVFLLKYLNIFRLLVCLEWSKEKM